MGGFDYAPEYDFSEFWAATDGRYFRVIVAGNPFPQLPLEQVKQRLLPVMQANKPRPALTFTYQLPPRGAEARLSPRAGVRSGQRSDGGACLCRPVSS